MNNWARRERYSTTGCLCTKRHALIVEKQTLLPGRVLNGYKQWLSDLRMGLENLLAHPLRSLLTCLE